MGDIAQTRMKLDFQLFKGASIRFHDVGNASEQATQLMGSTTAIKNSMSLRAESCTGLKRFPTITNACNEP